jgi:hypothetical protein
MLVRWQETLYATECKNGRRLGPKKFVKSPNLIGVLDYKLLVGSGLLWNLHVPRRRLQDNLA